VAPKAGCFCEPLFAAPPDELPPPPLAGVGAGVVWTGWVSVGAGVVSVGAAVVVDVATEPAVDASA
jgi:hypothetical protein